MLAVDCSESCRSVISMCDTHAFHTTHWNVTKEGCASCTCTRLSSRRKWHVSWLITLFIDSRSRRTCRWNACLVTPLFLHMKRRCKAIASIACVSIQDDACPSLEYGVFIYTGGRHIIAPATPPLLRPMAGN